jgi:hypothetical protein
VNLGLRGLGRIKLGPQLTKQSFQFGNLGLSLNTLGLSLITLSLSLNTLGLSLSTLGLSLNTLSLSLKTLGKKKRTQIARHPFVGPGNHFNFPLLNNNINIKDF